RQSQGADRDHTIYRFVSAQAGYCTQSDPRRDRHDCGEQRQPRGFNQPPKDERTDRRVLLRIGLAPIALPEADPPFYITSWDRLIDAVIGFPLGDGFLADLAPQNHAPDPARQDLSDREDNDRCEQHRQNQKNYPSRNVSDHDLPHPPSPSPNSERGSRE